jgi:hypothetical protein
VKRIALVVGNGLTRSFARHSNVSLNPSFPLRWNLLTPGRSSRLIDDLPGLKAYIERVDPERKRDDFDLIIPFIEKLSPAPIPTKLPDDELAAFLDLCHYLTVAYSWLQLDFDRHALSEWTWTRWLFEHRKELVALLSWNYDLVAERLLEEASLPFVYAGIGVGPTKGRGRHGRRPPVIVSKPHGSCNFAADETVSISTADSDGGPYEALTYPRLMHVAGYDGPMQVLPRNRLYSIRQVADIVLPGEWNRFHRYLNWVNRTLSAFVRGAADATDLVVIGFRMAECDRPEFELALSWMRSLERIVIADPDPNPRLLETLAGRAPELLVWPDGPFGASLRVE